MNTRITVFIVFLICSSFCSAQESKWKSSIVGTWLFSESSPNGLTIIGTTTYLENGDMTMSGKITYQTKERKIDGSGKWKIEDGYLLITLEHSSTPDILPDGHITKDKIIDITAKEYTYIGSSGKHRTETRVEK